MPSQLEMLVGDGARDATKASMPAASSEEDVRTLLGEIDARVIEQIIETGATPAQIEEAIADVRRARDDGAYRTPSSILVAEVRTILENLEAPDEDYIVRAMD